MQRRHAAARPAAVAAALRTHGIARHALCHAPGAARPDAVQHRRLVERRQPRHGQREKAERKDSETWRLFFFLFVVLVLVLLLLARKMIQ